MWWRCGVPLRHFLDQYRFGALQPQQVVLRQNNEIILY
jgi:hypothetical protein